MSRNMKLAVIGLLIAFACSASVGVVIATGGQGGGAEEPSGVEGAEVPVDWSNDSPLVNGQPTTSLTSAASDVPFTPIAPESFGDPKALMVTDPATASETDRSFAAVYDDPEHGTFWVVENSTTSTPDSMKEMVTNCTAESGCETKMELITLTDGSPAVVMRQNTQAVMWVANGVLYDVVGPVEKLSWDDSIALADEIAKVAAAS